MRIPTVVGRCLVSLAYFGVAIAMVVAAPVGAQPADPTSIALGSGFACGLSASGVVRCWGANDSGQLGMAGASASASTVTLSQPAVAIAAGYSHACARFQDGTAACWGGNRYGQIGVETIASRAEPALLQGLPGVTALELGQFFGCGLAVDGTVFCWGDNTYRQLGSASPAFRFVPTAVRGLRDVRSISVGANHACAILADGKVKCWGSNDWGQLGRGRRGGKFAPTEIRELRGATSLALGQTFTCGKLASGSILCAGQNLFGGPDPSASIYPRATAIVGVGDVASWSAGWSENLCVVTNDHHVRCSGVSRYGQLNPVEPYALAGMTEYPGLTDIRAVAVSDEQLCVFGLMGVPRCAGHGTSGQLGTGGRVDSRALTPVAW